MFEINRLGNILVAEILEKSFVVEVHSKGVAASVVSGGKEIARQEVTALADELTETAFEVTLELMLNESFGDIGEIDDELIEQLGDELQEELLELVKEGQKTKSYMH